MARVVKQADERRQELLDTAMRLFVERGFNAVSMRDIASAAQVTPGLAYHYFDSKQTLFGQVLESYARQCAAAGVRILDDPSSTFPQKIDALLETISREEHLPYHEFFHKEGNRAFHDQLSVSLCDLLVPHLAAAIRTEGRRRGARIESPETLADFIAHGLINLLSDPDTPDPDALTHVRSYIEALMASQLAAASGSASHEHAVVHP